MKIGIITQPLQDNYGGLLQAYALQKVLRSMGHEVWTINRKAKETSFYIKYASIINRLIKSIFGEQIRIRVWPKLSEKRIISRNTQKFVTERINLTQAINSEKQFSLLNSYHFGAYIVGSDQVWRPKYSPNIYNYFLDFIADNKKIRRLAYAASFGTDRWEFSDEETQICKLLLKKFDAISVREDSGIQLCKEKLGVDALHVLDPTLLLTKEDFIELLDDDEYKLESNINELVVYVLDKSEKISSLIEGVASKNTMIPYNLMPGKKFSELRNESINECIFKSVEEWIGRIMNASLVITDSYHGCIFSIIFNKQFICLENKERGSARFRSLLKIFGLENRLFSPEEYQEQILNVNINYDHVNEILIKERAKALNFLSTSLQ